MLDPHPRPSRTLTLAAALTAALLAAPALAQQPAPPATAPPDAPDAKREEARAHFEKGVALFEEEAWSAALAEFLSSRAAFPTRTNTKNAAICLRKLHRFDEALEMFESLLREFPNLPPDDKAMAERALADLRGLVGAVDIRGAEPGSTVIVDGRDRGKAPLPGPLRVGAGTHVVRVYKEGFAPFEARVDVAGGQTSALEARLGALTQAGRLRVAEQSGKALEVLVDSVVVGTTPWEGPLSVGEHTITLRGEGKLGTQPATARVELNQLASLTLAAEDLDASIRVEPTPAGASVAVDAVTVGRGVWEGRLRPGGHRIEIAAEGFLPLSRQVSLDKGEREVVTVQLQRDPDSAMWRAAHPSKFTFEIDGAFGLTPSFGGDVAGDCSDPCSKGLGVGALATLHAGYQLGSGLGFGVAVGYLALGQSTTGRETQLLPQGLPANPGTADDELALRGLLVGASGSLHLGERFPFLGRLGVGAMLGSVADRRSGRFTTVERTVNGAVRPALAYEAGPLEESPAATYFYVAPEVRLGVRIGDHLELSGGAQVLVLIAIKQPEWQDETFVPAATDGAATFGPQALTGRTVLVIAPGLGARYDF